MLWQLYFSPKLEWSVWIRLILFTQSVSTLVTSKISIGLRTALILVSSVYELAKWWYSPQFKDLWHTSKWQIEAGHPDDTGLEARRQMLSGHSRTSNSRTGSAASAASTKGTVLSGSCKRAENMPGPRNNGKHWYEILKRISTGFLLTRYQFTEKSVFSNKFQ